MRSILILIAVVFASPFAMADRILMLGDSLTCGPFGIQVVQNLNAAGHDVTVYCAVSSRPENWLAGTNPKGQICQTLTSSANSRRTPVYAPCSNGGAVPKLDQLLARTPADKVIAAFGTNSLPDGTTAPQAYRTLATMIRGRGPCQWIGPPNFNASQGAGWTRYKPGSAADIQGSREHVMLLQSHLDPFYTSLSAKVDATCPLIDSRPATASGPAHETVDGVHRGRTGGPAWANALRNQIGTFSGGTRAGGSRSSN